MTHNKKDVAWELGSAQVVVFGHTHKYFEKIIDDRLWINPGSCGRRRFESGDHYGCYACGCGEISGGKNSY